jgi:hypothetical protein
MATRYDQFTKVRSRYSHQAQLRTPAVSPVVAVSQAGTPGTVTLTRYSSYTVSRSRGSGRGGYAIP